MTFDPLNLISANSWKRATFTTYALSLSFFEAVVLDALIRAGAREAFILSDVQGVKMALGELGARRVGKDYDVEPLNVEHGIFHAKVSVLESDDDCHVLVGSGNLTFGGWGQNCEVIEHLHPSFAADAIEDTAGFFEALALSDEVTHGADEQCAAIAEELRGVIGTSPRTGDIRVIHSLDGSIAERLVEEVYELGGATRLVVASPFWGGGKVIDSLCHELGIENVSVHAHGAGTVQGKAGSNWPFDAKTNVSPIKLNLLDDEPRPLHAKMLEVVCKRGRLVLSGSANATSAALGRNQNVEACVLRIQRETLVGWETSVGNVPSPTPHNEEDPEETHAHGILRATLDGDQVVGQVLTPVMNGEVSVWRITTAGSERLAATTLNDDGRFEFESQGLEMLGWQSDRITLCVENSEGKAAEGFLSIAAFREIKHRAGAITSRLFAVLAGTETPDDVAAIMSWFQENPNVLAGSRFGQATGHGDHETSGSETPSVIEIDKLDPRHSIHTRGPKVPPDGSPPRSWQRFMDNIHAAFRQRRGPQAIAEKPNTETGEIGEDPEVSEDKDSPSFAIEAERACSEFEKLLDDLLADGKPGWQALIAFDLCQYICDRLRPASDRARVWLDRILRGISDPDLPDSYRSSVHAAILINAAASQDKDKARSARSRLLRLGLDRFEEMPATDKVQSYAELLVLITPCDELWKAVKEVRTAAEQRTAYLAALDDPAIDPETYAELPSIARDEWETLNRALLQPDVRNDLLFAPSLVEACPNCHMQLPTKDIHKLRNVGIAKTSNCCRRVIILTDEDRTDG